MIELDKYFWRPGLAAAPPGQWAAMQRRLAQRQSWIMDGDLGPYDVASVRLEAADIAGDSHVRLGLYAEVLARHFRCWCCPGPGPAGSRVLRRLQRA